MTRYDIVIVGSGHGGAQTAIALRQRGFDGSIAIVGEEPELPYERPPLSKAYLANQKPFERLLIRPASFWRDRSIEMLIGRRVVLLDPDAHSVATADAETIAYGTLVWSAGGHARRLTCSGADLLGVHAVRSRADVDQMIAELPNVERIVVIGGGYIGLEAAAVLSKLGKHVTVLEAEGRLLSRVTGPALSGFIAAEHRSHGVDVRLGVRVESIVGDNAHATGVRLEDGSTIACDMVIVGIGIEPAVAPLIEAGALGGNGVLVDAYCKTSLADVYALGDCALHSNRFAAGKTIRLESVQNAADMATVVARSLVNDPVPYESVPWFWSDQYDLELQTVGLSADADEEIIQGDGASRAYSIVYLRGGHVIALDCVNAIGDYVRGRALVTGSKLWDDRTNNAHFVVPLQLDPSHAH